MSAGKNARLTALKALLRVEEGKGYSNLVLDHGLAASGLDGRDAAFASALFYGVLERRITLDYQISRYSKMPLSQMAAPVREILRLGFYQLLYMDKVPQSAAVNESVKLTRAVKKDKASGFVNGILRSFIRDGCPCRLPAETADDYLMVKYACPQWIIDLWITSYGRERALELLENLTGRPPLAVRVNSCKTTREALTERLKEEGVETKLYREPVKLSERIFSRTGSGFPALLPGAVSQAGRAGLRRMRRAGRKNLYYGGADGKPGRAFLL